VLCSSVHLCVSFPGSLRVEGALLRACITASVEFAKPPEDDALSVRVPWGSPEERVEWREYRYTRVEVVLRKGDGGEWSAVSHGSRSVGFTGWIGGVAVFDRALTQAELSALSDVWAAGSSTVRGELP